MTIVRISASRLTTIGFLSVFLTLAIGGVSATLHAQVASSDVTESVLIQRDNDTGPNPMEPPADGPFVRHGQVSSSPSLLPTFEGAQTAEILEPREENTVYSGMVTFEASRPVSLVSWQIISGTNSTLLTEQFGDFDDVIVGGNELLAVPAQIASGTSGSVPFVGNALVLISEDGDDEEANEPFLATYSVQGTSGQPTRQNELGSLIESSSAAESVPGPDDETEGEQ